MFQRICRRFTYVVCPTLKVNFCDPKCLILKFKVRKHETFFYFLNNNIVHHFVPNRTRMIVVKWCHKTLCGWNIVVRSPDMLKHFNEGTHCLRQAHICTQILDTILTHMDTVGGDRFFSQCVKKEIIIVYMTYFMHCHVLFVYFL